MDTLEDCMISSPLPCAHLVISDQSQMDFYSMILSSGQTHTSNMSNRLFLKVIEDKEMDKMNNKAVNWLNMEINEPTCIICCRDWQSYKLELKGSQESVSDSSLVNVIPNSDASEDKTTQNEEKVEIKINKSFIMKGTLKNLETLIKEDIENCLSIYKESNFRKMVPCKFLFLVLLNENLKNPNKAIAGLKNLNPNEVAAICVTCGLSDITIKLSKVEQLMYEISLSYYEKKVHKLSKVSVGIKNRIQTNPNETDEIYFAATNFKMGFFSEFLSNSKDALNKYTTCWNSIKNMNKDTNIIDKATIAFYVSLRMLHGHFTNSNVISALALSFEIFEYMKDLLYIKNKGLYYNIMYLTNYVIASKFEELSNSDDKNYTSLMQHAANYYKWTLQFLIQLRKVVKTLIVSNRGHFIPHRFGQIFFYEDMDFGNLYSETSNEESLNYGNTLDINASEVFLLEETERLIGKLLKCFSNFIWKNSLLQIYSLIGDSLFLSYKYKEALNIYLSVFSNIMNPEILETDDILKEYKQLSANMTNSEHSKGRSELEYIYYVNALIISECCYNRSWIALCLTLISKIVVSLSIILSERTKIPSIIYDMADIDGDIDWYKTENDSLNVYETIFIKSVITLISLKSDSSELIEYLHKISLTILNNNIKSFVILSKTHRSQYTYAYCKSEECIDILINFRLDFPCEVITNEGLIDTTLGAITFHITEYSSFDDIVVVHANSNETHRKEVTLPRNKSIILSLTYPSSYSKNDFKIFGLTFNWKINEIIIFCIVAPISLYNGSIIYSKGRIMGGDSRDNIKLGLISSSSCVPTHPNIISKRNYLNQSNYITELTVKLLEMNSVNSGLAKLVLGNANNFIFKNSIRMKVVVDTVVRGSMAPITFVFSYDKILKYMFSDLKFFVETDSNVDICALTDFCNSSNIYKLCKSRIIEFVMDNFIEYSKLMPGTCKFTDNEFSSGSVFSVSVEDNIKHFFFKDSKQEQSIVCIFGLIKIPTSGNSDINFTFCCQENNGTNSPNEKITIAKERVSILVHEPLNVSLTVNNIYDNESGKELKSFSIDLVNNAFIKYEILSVKLLSGSVIISENTDLFGFEQAIDSNQRQQLVYIKSTDRNIDKQFRVEVISSIICNYAHPFDYFKEHCNIITNESYECEDVYVHDIEVYIKHNSVSTLGDTFYMTTIIENNSNEMQVCETFNSNSYHDRNYK
ncbi:hypothetical protein BEWA_011410 [Theileria equi strain WA]|uniref:Trafficking protein particle complex subunit 11 domain-containing protein n=1 Tax=Theileria equi strain WA TaxID=1537102 RepID=L0B2K6_THEEQ|nr:hypothetical protein BEWA_011410 [Theileria equi strain WA]AFZ81723.1 hypothetical protein BEWA_011410 [Theileria equi strain WA]|eukprot:XP_004831389.1 hypothetical protein BEWA_011410 [Theileria equi strain WA]